MKRARRLVALGSGVALCACLGAKSSLEPPPPGGHHVLFIGNSLTYTNDLPSVVVGLASSVGDTVKAASVAYANYALIDHWYNGEAKSAVQLGGWEYVVMQQGPTSTTGLDRDTLILATRYFDQLVRAQGGKSALFEVWPDYTRQQYWDNSRDSYQMAARAVGGVFMPAGEAWRAAWAADSTLALYGGDGFHPSPLGTYLAALEIYERVTGHDARNLPVPASIGGIAVTSAVVRLLQESAHTANTTYP